jgi:hypothetical protein
MSLLIPILLASKPMDKVNSSTYSLEHVFQRIDFDHMIGVPDLREQDSVSSPVSESVYVRIKVINQIRG